MHPLQPKYNQCLIYTIIKVASLDINTEVEIFQSVPKPFEGELGFHLIWECIPDLNTRKRETLPVIVRSGPRYGNIIL